MSKNCCEFELHEVIFMKFVEGPGASSDSESLSLGRDIKFRTINVEEMRNSTVKHKIKVEDEVKKKEELEFKKLQQEQTYKRLMHLLTKSQFYSKFISDKISTNPSPAPVSKKTRGIISKAKKGEDEIYTPKRSSRVRVQSKKYDLKNYVSPDVSKIFYFQIFLTIKFA